MNTENLYINDERFFKYCEENRLLDDTQIEVLKQAAVNVDHIFFNYFIPVKRVDDLIRYCQGKVDYYRDYGFINRADDYRDMITMLKSLSMDEDEA